MGCLDAARGSFTLSIALFAMACGPDRRPASGWAGTMDTLSSGAVVVNSPSSGMWDSSSMWRIEEQVVIGAQEGEGPDVFGGVVSVEADRGGRVYVLDRVASEIRVFEHDGRFVRSFGGAGAGPGEFRMAAGMSWDPEGRLWVADLGNARFSVFDTTGQLLASYPRRLSNVSDLRVRWHGGVDTAGRPYDYGTSRDGHLRLLRLAPATTLTSTLAVTDTFQVPAYDVPARSGDRCPCRSHPKWCAIWICGTMSGGVSIATTKSFSRRLGVIRSGSSGGPSYR
jgi:hypothetical protein